MRIVLFYHSLRSDWNHKNAHFLRGIASEFAQRGHEVEVCEARDARSFRDLVCDQGEEAALAYQKLFPFLKSTQYDPDTLDLEKILDSAHLVLVHESNPPELIRAIGKHRLKNSHYSLFFHDTHHLLATTPETALKRDLSHYDGVLAFGESLAQLYRTHKLAHRVWTWNQAADTRLFHPSQDALTQGDLLWVGNWGEDNRTQDFHDFLVSPVRDLGLCTRVHGVRFPKMVRALLEDTAIDYQGWIANHKVARLLSEYRLTLDLPRKPYLEKLPGIPSIRVFEALACGTPLICRAGSKWKESENLFTPGKDFLLAETPKQMRTHMKSLLFEPGYGTALARHGRETLLEKHTVSHRVDELFKIHLQLRPSQARAIHYNKYTELEPPRNPLYP